MRWGGRAALADVPEQMAEFEAGTGGTPAFEPTRTPVMWALPPGTWMGTDWRCDRLAAGALSGSVLREDPEGPDNASGPEVM
ncbi:hypothetical protein [Streptomyces lushanensis]|uniref:hypothetical protein n=1 Tax=Streptomyces lushanensis TaxID=1434255 RepID=UPI000835A59B|nr:hypothetical protein [Streptomyces lushanensis]